MNRELRAEGCIYFTMNDGGTFEEASERLLEILDKNGVDYQFFEFAETEN